MTVDVDALIDAAREETRKPWPGLGITDELCAEQGLIVDLADALVKLQAERDLLKAVALRQVQYRKTQVARLTRERDEAHATIEKVRASIRRVLSGLDSYSWHQRDAMFVQSTREHAAVAYDALSNASGAALNVVKAEAIREWGRIQQNTVEKIGTEEDDFAETARWVDAAMKYADRIEKGLTMTQGEAND